MFGLGGGGGGGASVSPSASQAGHQQRDRSLQQNESSTDDGRARFVQKYLTNCRSFYSCIYCRTHLANHDELVSRSFQGNRSRAYLFNSVINISCGPSVQRALNTGAHAVADIYCANCGTTMGWKYEKAYVESQKYKEGKYIIELAHVVRENRHLELDKRDMLVNSQQQTFGIASSPSAGSRCGIGIASAHRQQGNGNAIGAANRQRATSSSSSSASSAGSTLSPPRGHRWLRASSSSSSSSPSSSSSSSNHNHDNEQRLLMVDDNLLADGADYNADFYDGDAEDDEELMFPLYDGLVLGGAGDRSSCPSFSCSSSLFCSNKTRRSFYLESTPYDWKYSTTSTTTNNNNSTTATATTNANAASSALSQTRNDEQRRREQNRHQTAGASNAAQASTAAGSLGSASLSSPSESSASASPAASSASSLGAASPSARSRPATSGADETSLAPPGSAAAPTSAGQTNDDHEAGPSSDRHSASQHHETQFEFDSDLDEQERPASCVFKQASATNQCCDSRAQGFPSGAQEVPSLQSAESAAIGAKAPPSGCCADAIDNNSKRQQESTSTSRSNSLNLDDEEFYDCCADHEVSNSVSH